MTKQYLLGLDIGSSSVKASLIDTASGKAIASTQSPSEEMPILALKPGWAEQDPDMWWEHVVNAVRLAIKQSSINTESIVAIGIAYQMHGLVVVGKDHKPLRPSIIWCDSRAVALGDEAFAALGKDYCLSHLLNSPGNFTLSKLRWVKENEPEIFDKIHKFMLPGDFIAMKLSGEIQTTATGLSEGILWDFGAGKPSSELLKYAGIDDGLVPTVVPAFSVQSVVSRSAAAELGLKPGTAISYRAGDQPNNAFSLNVLEPGETAATAGTSGVIYSVTNENSFDPQSRVNTFVHVTNSEEIRNGILLCINGTGILNSWLRKNISSGERYSYDAMNAIAAKAPVGAAGLLAFPFGNGAERILNNKEAGASFHGLDFNHHDQSHLLRAAQEGIVFAMKYGLDIIESMGARPKVIRAGNTNMFQSPVFRQAFVNTMGARLELYDTNGANGAALGAGVGAGIYKNFNEAFSGLTLMGAEEPVAALSDAYEGIYSNWRRILQL